MVEVMKIMVTSFQRPCGHTAVFSALTLQQITVDPGLCQGHLDALGQVWVNSLAQSYGFSCSHVWVCKLNYKES